MQIQGLGFIKLTLQQMRVTTSSSMKELLSLLLAYLRKAKSHLITLLMEKGEYATHEDLEKLLRNKGNPIKSRFAHRVIKVAEILSSGTLGDVLTSQLCSWAVAGKSCGRRADAELDSFYSHYVTGGQFLNNEGSTLETRVAVSLAKLRDHLLEEMVPQEEKERLHAIGSLKKKAALSLGLAGDYENLVDRLEISAGQYGEMSLDHIMEVVLKGYTPECMVDWICREINKKSDSTIPSPLLADRIKDQQTPITYKGRKPAIDDFYDEYQCYFTHSGAKALLCGLGYLREDFDEK